MKNPAHLYEVSFFSALCMVFPESWKRRVADFYAHDCSKNKPFLGLSNLVQTLLCTATNQIDDPNNAGACCDEDPNTAGQCVLDCTITNQIEDPDNAGTCCDEDPNTAGQCVVFRILRPRALFYRSDSNRSFKFLRHALP